jgi:hypothetical protein
MLPFVADWGSASSTFFADLAAAFFGAACCTAA